jgi:hypothetical protein
MKLKKVKPRKKERKKERRNKIIIKKKQDKIMKGRNESSNFKILTCSG